MGKVGFEPQTRDNKADGGYSDSYLYRNYLSQRFDGKRLNEITSFELERLKSELARKKLAPAAVRNCLVLFRQIFNKAVFWGLYDGKNSIKGVKMVKMQNARQRFLSFDEADRLLKALKEVSEAVHDMALLSLHTGMRFGEIANLKSQDLDFENGIINVSDPENTESRKAFMTKAVRGMLSKRRPGSPEKYLFVVSFAAPTVH